jgi:hypothetical protein
VAADSQIGFVAILAKTIRWRPFKQWRQIVRRRDRRAGIGVWHDGEVACLGSRVQYDAQVETRAGDLVNARSAPALFQFGFVHPQPEAWAVRQMEQARYGNRWVLE